MDTNDTTPFWLMDMNETNPVWPGGATIVADWEMSAIIKKIKSLQSENDALRADLQFIPTLLKIIDQKDKFIDNLISLLEKEMNKNKAK